MPIHFAGARRPERSALVRCLVRPGRMRAVNDNGCAIGDNSLLRSALLHFAEHGLGAAAEARGQAEDAWLMGDGDSYRHWLAVCRTLDGRMADRAAKRPAAR
jgi:hypothetical protein